MNRTSNGNYVVIGHTKITAPSINVNIFTSVQTIHFWGRGGVCENLLFFFSYT